MNKEKIVQAIIKQGILPLYFHSDEKISMAILRSLYDSGIRVIEYTNRGKQALKNFRKKTDNPKPHLQKLPIHMNFLFGEVYIANHFPK